MISPSSRMTCLDCGTATAPIYISQDVVYTPSKKRPHLTRTVTESFCRPCFARREKTDRLEEEADARRSAVQVAQPRRR